MYTRVAHHLTADKAALKHSNPYLGNAIVLLRNDLSVPISYEGHKCLPCSNHDLTLHNRATIGK